jgi:serine/threonine-protein kinase
MLDLRLLCLDRRRAELGAIVRVLSAEPDADTVDRAVGVAYELTPLDACADVEALLADVPPPASPQLRERVAAMQQRLDRVRALEAAGRYQDALALAAPLAADARATEYAPIAAHAAYTLGALRDTTGDIAGAEASLRDALRLAARARDDKLSVRVWAKLILVAGDRAGRPDEALAWTPAAEAAAERARDGALLASVLSGVGAVHVAQRNFDEAEALYARALELRVRHLGAEHPKVATLHFNMGYLHQRQGNFAEAQRDYERASELWKRTLGPNHPDVADADNNIGSLLYRQGDYDGALVYFRRALTVHEAAFGAEHSRAFDTRDNIATTYQEQGRAVEARAEVEAILAGRRRLLGPDHPRVALSLIRLGVLAMDERDYDAAREWFEQAAGARERAFGSSDARVGGAYEYLGEVALLQARHADARDYYERALAIYQAELGADHPDLASALLGAGSVAIAEGRHRDAVAPLERALTLLEGKAVSPSELGEVRFALAKAVARTDRRRARKLAAAARANFVADEAGERVAAVDAWKR